MTATPNLKNEPKSLHFFETLNKQDSSIQYTIEFENNQKQLNLLDITITNNGTDCYDFRIFRKPVITNVHMKSNSNMAANVFISGFKRFLSRSYKISSERYIDEENQFLIEAFTENGYLKELQKTPVHNKYTREDISKLVKPPWIPIIGPKLRQAFNMKNISKTFLHQA